LKINDLRNDPVGFAQLPKLDVAGSSPVAALWKLLGFQKLNDAGGPVAPGVFSFGATLGLLDGLRLTASCVMGLSGPIRRSDPGAM